MNTVGDGAFRREDLYGRSNDMGFSGALSFLRRKYTRDLTGVDVAVTGFLSTVQQAIVPELDLDLAGFAQHRQKSHHSTAFHLISILLIICLLWIMVMSGWITVILKIL